MKFHCTPQEALIRDHDCYDYVEKNLLGITDTIHECRCFLCGQEFYIPAFRQLQKGAKHEITEFEKATMGELPPAWGRPIAWFKNVKGKL